MRDVAIVVLLIAGVFLALIMLGYQTEKMACEAIADAMSVRHKYSFWTGCMIEHDGKMIPLEALRVMQ